MVNVGNIENSEPPLTKIFKCFLVRTLTNGLESSISSPEAHTEATGTVLHFKNVCATDKKTEKNYQLI